MFRLALKMLIGDRTKYAGLLFGITFTSFLVTFAASYFCGFMTEPVGGRVGHGPCGWVG